MLRDLPLDSLEQLLGPRLLHTPSWVTHDRPRLKTRRLPSTYLPFPGHIRQPAIPDFLLQALWPYKGFLGTRGAHMGAVWIPRGPRGVGNGHERHAQAGDEADEL